jgi:putative inorganic carbon (hco3(-)) transporter
VVRRVLPYLELACALAAAALWYQQGGAIWYAGTWPGPWPLLLLGLMWIVHWLWAGFSLRPSRFDVLLALFVVSAWAGTQTAYDPGPAWAKFWLVVGAWGLYYAMIHQPDVEHRYGTLAAWGLFGVALAAYFFLTNDWSAHPVKVPALIALGETISARLPSLSGHRLNANVTGGMLAMVLPVYVPLIGLLRTDEHLQLPRWLQRLLPVAWMAAAGVTLLGLLVSTSRGAWIAVLGGGALWALWQGLGRWVDARARLKWMVGVGATGAVLLVAAFSVILAYDLPGAAALTNRLTLLQKTLLLARDYVFTGAGLGTFMMNYSIYTLLIHVGHSDHSHNLLVDLVIEQGIVGLALFLALVILCLAQGLRRLQRSRSRTTRWLTETGLVALAVVLIHGMVDDVLYGSRGLLLLFVPFALVRNAGLSARKSVLPRRTRKWATITLGALLVAGVIFWRPLLAQWHASRGAMLQARTELALYEFEDRSGFIMDPIRQKEPLREPIAHFERAVALRPGNATARQRLAGIHLSRGEYEAAYDDSSAAWGAGHRDSITRLLLGDALVALGKVEEGISVLHGLTWALPRMEGQAWSRYWVNEKWEQAAYAYWAAAMLDPKDGASAAKKAQEAERRATQAP